MTLNAKVVGSNPVQSLKFFQVIFPVVLCLHSNLSFFHYLIATLGHLLPYKKEDDTIFLDDDVYYCLLVESLDSGDTRTTEEDNEIQPEDDTPQVSTRSGR